MEMAKARQTAFHATGDYKLFEASTPTIQGIADRRRSRRAISDTGRPCPHCSEHQRLVFGSKDRRTVSSSRPSGRTKRTMFANIAVR